MRYALSPGGIALLKKQAGPGTLFAFDFDGTLAPVRALPGLARISRTTLPLLKRLSTAAPTAAITGRSLKNIRSLVPRTFRAWAGNHGAEILPRIAQKTIPSSAKKQVREWAGMLERKLSDEGGRNSVWVEKKTYSLALHFRACRNRALSRLRILEAVSSLNPPPRVVEGKCVVNLLLPDLPQKGEALLRLLRKLHLRRAIYVGDDENDEVVFSLRRKNVCSVRIGRWRGSRAALYLKRQSEIDRFLRLLLSLQDLSPPAIVGAGEKKGKVRNRNRPRRHKSGRRPGHARRKNPRRAKGAHSS
ncbi:MAG TPA: trehalose-phosphatase [Bdellovibrionota bacterium]|jgi:trehalose 6-phosphate phosphatase